MNQPTPRPRSGFPASARPLTGKNAAFAHTAPRARRIPLAAWVILAVVAAHLIFFWVVADKHFLPKTRHVPPAPPVNFAARADTSTDPATGETITEQQFVVSTHLATPPPSPAPLSSPRASSLLSPAPPTPPR